MKKSLILTIIAAVILTAAQGIRAEEIKKTRETLNQILCDTTGKPLKKIEKDTDRNYFLSAKEALDYGLIDKIYSSNK